MYCIPTEFPFFHESKYFLGVEFVYVHLLLFGNQRFLLREVRIGYRNV